MPLPIGTPKTKSQLENQADATYKDNGGSDLTKTRGLDVRQFFADLLESSILSKEDFVETRIGTSAELDKEAQYFQNTNLDPNAGDIDVLATNAVNGVVVKLYHQDSAEPNLTFFGFDSIFSASGKENYNPAKINVYVFTSVVRAPLKVCEWTRYVLNP